MTVIQSASRYAYTPAHRARQSTGDDVTRFSPTVTDEIDPDGGRAGNPVKLPITRQVKETADSRFEFSLPYRSAFFNTSSKDGIARDDRTAAAVSDDTDSIFGQPNSSDATIAAQSSAGAETTDGLSENPIDLLNSLLGGT